MKKTAKRLAWTLGAIMALSVVCVSLGRYFMYRFIQETDIKSKVGNALNDRVNARVTFSDIDFTVISSFPDVSMYMDSLCIMDSLTNDTLIAVDRISASLNVKDLLDKRISVKEIVLMRPYAHMSIDSTGNNNFDGLIRLDSTKTDSLTELPKLLKFDNVSVKDAGIRYDNELTAEHFHVKEICLALQGSINTPDSTLEIRYGKFSFGSNRAEFRGCISNDRIRFELSHNIENLDDAVSAVADRVDIEIIERMRQAHLGGNISGKLTVEGPLNDSLLGVSIKGNMDVRNLAYTSPKDKKIIDNGLMSVRFRYVTGIPDSTYIHMDTLAVSGPEISLGARGKLSSKKEKGLWIDASLKTTGNINMIKQTGLLSDRLALEGKVKADFHTSSSLQDLLHGYRLPKSVSALKNLDVRIKLPDIAGRMQVYGMRLKTDTLSLKADSLDIALDGKRARLDIYTDDITIDHNGTAENDFLKIHKADITVDGRKMTAGIDIDRVGYLEIPKDGKDTISLLAQTMDMKIAAKGKKFATAMLDQFAYSAGTTRVSGARVNAYLTRVNPRGKNLWDTGSIGALIVHYNGNGIDTYCRQVTGTFDYTGKIENLAVQSDSMSVSVKGNSIIANKVAFAMEQEGKYRIAAKEAKTRKTYYEIDVDVSSLKAGYEKDDKLLKIKTGRTLLGHSDITADVTASFAGESPAIDISLGGEYLDIDEVMYANNRANLAKGDPAAVPLDSIPQNKIPRGIGRPTKNIHLNMNLRRLKLSNMNLPDVTAEFVLKRNTTCIHNLTSPGIRLNTRLEYTDPYHSMSNVIIEFEKFDVKRLMTIMPDFGKLSPMISALNGTLDLKLSINNPIRQVISIDLKKARIAGTLQARDLSISDNEQFRTVAKTLMFKNKESTHIDSLAVAAKIDGGEVTILPFMLKVDRYKVAMSGTSSIQTGQVDYHVSILKSPVPFKFGLHITKETSKYKFKLVKTEYKKLDPSIKPWTDPGFTQFRKTLEKPVLDYISQL